MYHRYSINITQNPIDGTILTEDSLTKLVREVLIERFTDVLYFSRDNSRTYRIHNASATINLFQFTALSMKKIDFPETTNYFREYLREAFMQTLAKKISETHIVQIYNYNTRMCSFPPDPSACASFMQFMRNRFSNNEKLMRAAKKEYLKTIHGNDELKNIFCSLEGGLSSLI